MALANQKESAIYEPKQSLVMHFITYLTVLSVMSKDLNFYLQILCKVKNAELVYSKYRFILIGLAKFYQIVMSVFK